VKPGEPFKIHYGTDRPSRIAIFAVDEGILQVAGFRTPDPLGFFFQKRALEVRTSQILDLILPEFARLMAASAPGGDQAAAVGRNLNPFKRKRDKPVAFWSGVRDARPDGADYSFTVPEYFNGTLRVMAVAVSPDAVGAAEAKSLVRGDFVLSPNVPFMVAPGDTFEVSLGVANNVAGSGKGAQVQVAMEASPSLEVLGPASTTLPIDAMREGAATFRLRARDRQHTRGPLCVRVRPALSARCQGARLPRPTGSAVPGRGLSPASRGVGRREPVRRAHARICGLPAHAAGGGHHRLRDVARAACAEDLPRRVEAGPHRRVPRGELPVT